MVTFLNAECNDICPVLADEITQADRLLGPERRPVQFVVVNTDPLETSLVVTPPALTRTGLGGLPNVTYLTGIAARPEPRLEGLRCDRGRRATPPAWSPTTT